MRAVVKVEELQKIVKAMPTRAPSFMSAPVSITAVDGCLEIVMCHTHGYSKARVPAIVEEPGIVLPDPAQLKLLILNAPSSEMVIEKASDFGRVRISFVGTNVEYAIFCYPDEKAPEDAFSDINYEHKVMFAGNLAKELFDAARRLKPFLGDVLSGMEDFFLIQDHCGKPALMATDTVVCVFTRLSDEFQDCPLPMRLPARMFSIVPNPESGIDIFIADLPSINQVLVASDEFEATFSMRKQVTSLPEILIEHLKQFDDLPGFDFGDRQTLLKLLTLAENKKSKYRISSIAKFQSCSTSNAISLQVIDREYDGDTIVASFSFQTCRPGDFVAFFDASRVLSVVQKLPVYRFRFAPTSVNYILYCSDNKTFAAIAGLNLEVFAEDTTGGESDEA